MNKYEVLSTIGEGEYGVVRKARNKENDEVGKLAALLSCHQEVQGRHGRVEQEGDSAGGEGAQDDAPRKHHLVQGSLPEVSASPTVFIGVRYAIRRKGKVYLVCEYVERNLLQILEEVRCPEVQQVLP